MGARWLSRRAQRAEPALPPGSPAGLKETVWSADQADNLSLALSSELLWHKKFFSTYLSHYVGVVLEFASQLLRNQLPRILIGGPG